MLIKSIRFRFLMINKNLYKIHSMNFKTNLFNLNNYNNLKYHNKFNNNLLNKIRPTIYKLAKKNGNKSLKCLKKLSIAIYELT